MSQRLPIRIDLLNFVERQRQLAGNLDISAMRRLVDMLTQHTGQVKIELAFFNENGLAVVSGQIKTELMLKCQNCLETIIWPVDQYFKLGIISSMDAANRLPDGCEPLLLEEKTVALADMIEEELLLNIPLFPKHKQACIALEFYETTTEKPQSQSDNPFSILAKLKKTGD